VDDRGNDPQVASHRLLGRDQDQCPLLDLEALLVDRLIVTNDLLRGSVVAPLERLNRAGDGLVHHARQEQEVILQPLELQVEV